MYTTFAWFTLSRTHVFTQCSRHVSLQLFALNIDDISHQCWHHFGILLVSKLKKHRYRVSKEFLVCFSTPFGMLLLAPPKSSKIICFSTMLFNLIWDLKRVGLERPRAIKYNLMSFRESVLMLLSSFVAAFQHLLKNRSGGRVGENTVS